ncbi:MAG: hypothetical protein K6F07_03490 [Bacilli bacterium]|nr:hypothetical protein [Bacilli bacterium]
MAQSKKGRLNYRCPACFMREIDMDMFYDEEKGQYYCLRCGYVGDEADVLRLNEQARYRYHMMRRRVTSFNEDNEPLFSEEFNGEK